MPNLKLINKDTIIPIFSMENAGQQPEWCLVYGQTTDIRNGKKVTMTLEELVEFGVDCYEDFAGYKPKCGYYYKGNLYLEWRPKDGYHHRGWQESESKEE